MDQKVYVFDLDGSLIKTDLFWEGFLLFIKHRWYRLDRWIVIGVSFILSGGALCKLKTQLAKEVDPYFDPKSLPWIEEVVQFAKDLKEKDQSVVLASGSAKILVEKVAHYLGCFDASGVHASDDTINSVGRNKAKKLKDIYSQFSYVGNELKDLALWKESQQCFLVDTLNLKNHKKLKSIHFEKVFMSGRSTPLIKVLSKQFRVHQWVKNFLIFLPLLLAHKFSQESALMWGKALAAFLSFSFLASSVYILNDLFDLQSDRLHKTKKNRPLASGDLSILHAMILGFGLAIYSIYLASHLGNSFLQCCVLYFLLNLLYSFKLKKIVILDVFLLSGLYNLRIFAGSAVTSVELSSWLIIFSAFLFLGLAFLKRFIELKKHVVIEFEKIRGRGYQKSDEAMLMMFGVSAHFVCVLVFCLYIYRPHVQELYTHPDILWFTVILLLYWLCRVWLAGARDEVDDDPIRYALKTPMSYAVGVLVLIVIWLAK